MQANQANILKSRFLYNASQKLRPPLDDIVSGAEMLISGVAGPLPDALMDQQRQMLNHGRVMQALVEDMLDLSEIEAGHMQLNLQWVTLPPLMEEITNAARALHMAAYSAHHLTIRLDLMHLTDPLPPVWADVDRLRYILINLMSNAVKYTEEGEVVISATATDTDVLITVRDTGPGIGDDEMRYLFEPFGQQSAPVLTDQGTGLGLAVSRLLAMRHGGDLTVETRLREGTTFTLRLPGTPDGAPPPP
jgi:two-component system, sensor histidine kinase LadS